MSKEILVAYATSKGSTGEVAEVIGEVLQTAGASVDVRRAKEVKDVSQYEAVVAGTGIHAGRIYGELTRFLERNKATLCDIPVAYFVVCLMMVDPTEEHCKEAAAYLDPLRTAFPDIKPVDVGLFGGKMDFKKLSLPIRTIIKAMNSPEGDFRDWDAIRAWAASIAPQLLR